MRFPGHIQAGRVVGAPAELTDLSPTVADYLGLGRLDGASGVSLRAAIEGAGQPRSVARSICLDREANLAARAQDPRFPPTWRMSSVRTADARYTHREAPGFEDSFDQPTGAPEQDELGPLLREQTRRILIAADGAGWGRSSAGRTDRQMLEALGYLEGE